MRSWKAAKRTPKSNPLRSRFGRRALLRSRIGLEPLEERALLAVVHVALTGNDGTGDGSIANPYRTIQVAINATAADDGNDDIVRVAAGDYNVAGVDLGFTIPNDPNIDTLDIVGGWNATFTTQDPVGTPTNYEPQDAGGQIVVNDADVTIDGMAFTFDGTNTGILLNAGNFRLSNNSFVIGAVDGVVGDGLTTSVTIEDSSIRNNLHNGLQLTNHTGEVQLLSAKLNLNGNLGVDFQGAGFVSIQTTEITFNDGGGARILNPGAQVSVGNGSNISQNLAAGLVVNGASSLAIDASAIDLNALSGLTALNVAGAVTVSGNSEFFMNGFFGASLTNIGSLNVSNILVEANSAAGLTVSNSTGAVSITSATLLTNSTGIGIDGAASVTITDTSVTESTVANGVFITQVVGKVTIENGAYSSNTGIGIEVQSANEVEILTLAADMNGDGAILVENTTTTVSLNGVTSTLNSGGAFEITGAAAVAVAAFANGNDMFEQLLIEDVTGQVDIIAGGYVNGTGGALGVVINNVGALNVNNVFINDNASTGLSASQVTGNVTITGGQVAGNGFIGIELSGVGDVVLTDVQASNNDSVGMQILNANSVDDLDGTYNDNLGSGAIVAFIAGDVKFVGSNAEVNGGEGLLIADVLGTVTLQSLITGDNANDGTHVESTGDVMVDTLESNNGSADGAHFEQVASLSLMNVIAGANLSGAGIRVLDVTGAVIMQTINGSQNTAGVIVNGAASLEIGGLGAQLNSLSGLTVMNVGGDVSVTASTISNNGFHGAEVSSVGSLTITNANLDGNSAAGLSANNIAGAVSLSNSTFNDNGSGVGIDTAESVVVSMIAANNNTTSIGFLANNITGAGIAVDVEEAQFNGNSSDGVRISNVVAEVSIHLIEVIGNGEQGLDVNGADVLHLSSTILKDNVSGVGGQIDNVGQIFYSSVDVFSTADLIVVTGNSITLTADGDLQQPVTYTDDTFLLSIDAHDGDDTIQVAGPFTLGPAGGLHVFGGVGNDRLLAIGVTGFGGVVPMIFDGGDGNDTFTVSTGSNDGDIVEADGEFVQVRRGPNAEIATPEVHEYNNLEILEIFTGGGDDTIVVTEPQPFGTFPQVVGIFGDDGNDGVEINLGRPTIDTVFNFDGGAGANGLTVFTRSVNDNTVGVNPGQIIAMPRAVPGDMTTKTVNFQNIRGLNILADAGNDTFTVNSLNLSPGFERLSLFGQNDGDIAFFNVNDPASNGLMQFDGGAGADNRFIVVGANPTNHSFAVDSGLVQVRSGADPFSNPIKNLEYSNVQTLQILGSTGNDTFTVQQTGASLPATVDLQGGDAADRFVVNPASIPNTVGLELNLGAGNDTVVVNMPAAPIDTTLFVDGGNDNDLVQVNADAGGSNVAVGTFAGGDRIRIAAVELLFMNGGAGADMFTNNTSVNSILDGLGGNDTLIGGGGRDLVFGEGAQDDLQGLAEDDLLVSGPLTFDQHQVSLMAIMAEWISGRTFEERIANLSGTGIGPRNNGDVFLIPGVTVFDEGALDMLSGGTERDWFMAQTAVNDLVLDEQALEDELTQIP